MNLFEAVKTSLTTKQVAPHYGVPVGRNQMALCPFHDDHHPSMKVDKRFHCFACQADGDVIDFVARRYQLSPKESAEKLASDFGISYDRRYHPKPSKPIKPVLTKEQRYQQAENRCFRAYAQYHHLLMGWQNAHAPTSNDEPWHPLFVESLQRMQEVETLLDTLLSGSPDEKASIVMEYGKEIPALEKRIETYAVKTAHRSRNMEH